MHGGDALQERLAELRAEIAHGLVREGMRQSWHAQLSALTGTGRGRAVAERAGFSPRNLVAWLSEQRAPSKANQAAIERAYLQDREASRSRAIDAALRDRVTNRPTGTRVEIYTEDDDSRPRRQPTIDPDRWDDIVDAFEDDDIDELEAIWEDVIDELDTSGNEADLMIGYVSHLGF